MSKEKTWKSKIKRDFVSLRREKEEKRKRAVSGGGEIERGQREIRKLQWVRTRLFWISLVEVVDQFLGVR